MPQALAIIPARLASTRFPEKVLANIAGKSLIQRTYEQVIQCSLLDDVIIAADDIKVRDHAQSFGAKVIMTDPALPSGTYRVASALKQISHPASIILNVQADEPCFDPSIASILIQKLIDEPQALLTTPITPINGPCVLEPSTVKCVTDSNGRALYFSRCPIPYVQKKQIEASYFKHIGIYCFRRSLLELYEKLPQTPLQLAEDLEQLRILEMGYPIHTCLVNSVCLSVDIPQDIEKVEAYLCQKKESMCL
jgi:3-deoxy-manno-octulosonate cytidylyltransferase (CMP-KDO synthetase)